MARCAPPKKMDEVKAASSTTPGEAVSRPLPTRRSKTTPRYNTCLVVGSRRGKQGTRGIVVQILSNFSQSRKWATTSRTGETEVDTKGLLSIESLQLKSCCRVGRRATAIAVGDLTSSRMGSLIIKVAAAWTGFTRQRFRILLQSITRAFRKVRGMSERSRKHFDKENLT